MHIWRWSITSHVIATHAQRWDDAGMKQAVSWVDWARRYLYVFRVVVVGLCIIGAIVGWLTNIQWLFAAASVIGVGELLESTYYLVVIDWGTRSGRIMA